MLLLILIKMLDYDHSGYNIIFFKTKNLINPITHTNKNSQLQPFKPFMGSVVLLKKRRGNYVLLSETILYIIFCTINF